MTVVHSRLTCLALAIAVQRVKLSALSNYKLWSLTMVFETSEKLVYRNVWLVVIVSAITSISVRYSTKNELNVVHDYIRDVKPRILVEEKFSARMVIQKKCNLFPIWVILWQRKSRICSALLRLLSETWWVCSTPTHNHNFSHGSILLKLFSRMIYAYV